MKKIPTLFKRDPSNMARIIPEVNPVCQWVVDGEGVPTRKYDGTCVMLDDAYGEWWARREIKPDQTFPAGFQHADYDPATGKTVGWEPIANSSWYRWWKQAFECDRRYEGIGGGFQVGTYELIGPKVQGNPERASHHLLIAHADAEPVCNVPVDFGGLQDRLYAFPWEGIVWHHPDGRMAKIKRRDFTSIQSPEAGK